MPITVFDHLLYYRLRAVLYQIGCSASCVTWPLLICRRINLITFGRELLPDFVHWCVCGWPTTGWATCRRACCVTRRGFSDWTSTATRWRLCVSVSSLGERASARSHSSPTRSSATVVWRGSPSLSVMIALRSGARAATIPEMISAWTGLLPGIRYL